MVFSSLLFIYVFLPISLVLFYSAVFFTNYNKKYIYSLLTFLSLAFYFWGSGNLLLLLLASIIFNWAVGIQLAKKSVRNEKIILVASIALNLSTLLYFKYCRFFLDTVGYFSGNTIAPSLHPYLPVGISFYTFMTISYLVDVYRSPREKATLLEFGTYLSLFPHLVAGPIVRFSELAKDLRQHNSLSVNNFSMGIVRFTQGLGMKVLIADNLSPTVDHIFSLPQSNLSFGASWLGAFAYTFQIYFDFAGYSAMAIGIALMFGFHFPENFNRPYRAASITEFWKRWHMSLSRWLRDYIYIPLGGNKKGNVRTYVNLLLVFFICGLWHGAAWTFIVWGFYHGFLLIVERILKNNWNREASGALGIAITFLFTTIGWVIFRSETFAQCWYFLRSMFSFSGALDFIQSRHAPTEYMEPLFILCLSVASILSFFPARRLTLNAENNSTAYFSVKMALVGLIFFLSSIYAIGSSFKPFIYFRF